jgi:hypothetical protein
MADSELRSAGGIGRDQWAVQIVKDVERPSEPAAADGSVVLPRLPLTPAAESHKISLPPGYALFGHHQPRDNGEVRVDAYMFVSSLHHA